MHLPRKYPFESQYKAAEYCNFLKIFVEKSILWCIDSFDSNLAFKVNIMIN